MKQGPLANLTDWPDDLDDNFKLLFKGETARFRLEPDAIPYEHQRRDLELPGKRFLKSIR